MLLMILPKERLSWNFSRDSGKVTSSSGLVAFFTTAVKSPAFCESLRAVWAARLHGPAGSKVKVNPVCGERIDLNGG